MYTSHNDEMCLTEIKNILSVAAVIGCFLSGESSIIYSIPYLSAVTRYQNHLAVSGIAFHMP